MGFILLVVGFYISIYVVFKIIDCFMKMPPDSWYCPLYSKYFPVRERKSDEQ
jgi:hypothetical protein